MQYPIAISNWPEVPSDVMSGMYVRLIVHDNDVKFRDPRLKRVREIPPKVVEVGIFDYFFAITSDRK